MVNEATEALGLPRMDWNKKAEMFKVDNMTLTANMSLLEWMVVMKIKKCILIKVFLKN